MSVQRIGTNADETFTVDASEIAEGTFDGGGGSDVLVLTSESSFEIFDFTKATVLTNMDVIRGTSSEDRIRLTATQLASVSSFDSNGSEHRDVIQITGADVDFRDKTLIGSHEINIDPGANISVNSRDVALKLKGTGPHQHLTIEGLVLSNADRTALHNNGIDYVTDASGTTTQNLAAAVTGLGGDKVSVVKGQAAHLDAGENATVSDEHPLKGMIVELSDPLPSGDKLSLETSGNVTLTPALNGIEDLFVGTVKIGTLQRVAAMNTLALAFNSNATGGRVQDVIRSLTYQHDGPTLPAGQNHVDVIIEDDGSRTTKSTVTLQYPNEAPTDILLDGHSVLENSGFFVGRLSAVDPDEGDGATFSLLDDAGGRFEINSQGYLAVKNGSLIDYETAKIHTVTIRATDSSGLKFDKSFVITVVDSIFDNNIGGVDATSAFYGTAGNDTIVASDRNDFILGYAGNDKLFGGRGDDQLWGGVGADTLYGGSDRDIFVFDTKPGKTSIDTIADFNVKDDSIYLENKYLKLGSKGSVAKPAGLASKMFYVGSAAHDGDDRLIYNKKNGVLYYDDDGSGAYKAIAIAILPKSLKVTYHDFFVI